MLIRFSILPILLTLALAACVEKTSINNSGDLKATEVQSDFKENSDIEPNKIDTDKDKIISVNGSKNFKLHSTVKEIESKLSVNLNLSQSTDGCYTDNSVVVN